MVGRFHKIPQEIKNMISVVIIDELHLVCIESQMSVLLGCTPKYIIGLTATFERDDGLEKMSQAILGFHRVERKNEKRFML